MKQVIEFCGECEARKKRGLNKKIKRLLSHWALESHKLDSSKPVSYYYDLYVAKLREKWIDSPNKNEFYERYILE